MVNVPSWSPEGYISSMCTLYKILHGLCYFPQDIASLRPMQFLPTDSFFSINPLLTQMPSTVHLYQNNAKLMECTP